jgi:hypothetical protein
LPICALLGMLLGVNFSKVRKTSDLQRYADLKGKDVRTIRGWCQTGKIPAQRLKGRWQINPHLILKEESLRRFRTWFGDGNGKRPLTERDKRALEYVLVKMGLGDSEERRKYLTYRFIDDPEERQKFRDAYAEIISGRYADLMAAAEWLMLKNGAVPTIEELAKYLHTSKSTLYRRLPGIARVLKQRYHADDLPDGVAAPILLPWGVQAASAAYLGYAATDADD